MPQHDDKKGPDTAGRLRDIDHKFGGEGVRDEQVEAAEALLANPLPHVERNTDMFGQVDTSEPLSLMPEEMIEIPSLGEEDERTKKDHALLESLMAKEIQANIQGNTEEEAKIAAQIKMLKSRMNPN